jgi:hypothetical protein
MSLLVFLLVTLVMPLILRHWSGYCDNVTLAWDLLGSAMTGGRSGETISGRTGSSLLEGKLKGKLFAPVIDLIMAKRGHCVLAVEGDRRRAEAVLADYEKSPAVMTK